MLTTMIMYKIMTSQKNTISSLVPKRCQPSAAYTTSVTLRVDVIVTQYIMLFRQQTRRTTAPNTTTSMTDVFYYLKAIKTTTLVVDDSLGIYPTVDGFGVPKPFYRKLPFETHYPHDRYNVRNARLTVEHDGNVETDECFEDGYYHYAQRR